MRNNKGQAAMEFLMTYGWAILIVVIAVAALAAFGVFNPQRFAQERCVGDSTKFACTSNAISIATDGTLQMELSNGAGETINVTDVTVSGDGDCVAGAAGTSVGTWTATRDGTQVAGNGFDGLEVRPNDELLFTIQCDAQTAGGVFDETFTINYNIVDGVTGLRGSIETVVKT